MEASNIMFLKILLLPPLALNLLGPTTVLAAPRISSPAKTAPVKPSPWAFQLVIPAEMEQQVTVKPSWLPLSKQLAALQDATNVPLTRAPSVPDDPLFVAAPDRTEFSLLHQVRLLLNDGQWQCQWANRDLGKDHHAYRLWREAVSPQERQAKMAQVAKDRLAKLLALIQAEPSPWDAARQEDPNLSILSQPIKQAPLLLASQLSPDQINDVLTGAPLALPVAAMSPQDQALVRQAVAAVPNDGIGMRVTNSITGETHLAFNMKHLQTTGEIVFEAKPLGGDPGTLGLSMTIYTEPAHEMGAGGSEMLYPNDPDFAQDEKKQIAARHRQEAADALAAKTPGAKTVTIDKAAQPQPGEPPLAAYLRAFAEQTKLTVLAHWPLGSKALTDDKGLPKRLPSSIVDRPAGEALDILCKTYGGEWVQDEATVRLRALPVPEPAVKRGPVVPAPPASPAASPVPGK